MEKLFLTVWHMSLTAVPVILAVLAVRLCLKKAPKVFSYALWAVVLLRLLCPVTVDSPLGLVPSARSVQRIEAEAVRPDPVLALTPNEAPVPAIPGGTPTPADTVVRVEPSAPAVSVQKGLGWTVAAAWLWLGGMAALAGYSLISLLRLKRKLREATPLEGQSGVWLTDHVSTPFVLGLVRPRIYLPAGLPGEEWDYVLLHERTHIRRLDHVVKALAWLAVTVHWFNPLVWLAFRLAGRDMEMSCDEAVLKKLGEEIRGDYSRSLLRLSAGKGLPVGPLAFGDGDTKGRIQNILRYKKPTLWILLLALTAVAVAAVVLLTGRAPRPEGPKDPVEVEIAFTHSGVDPTSSFFVPEYALEAAEDYVAGTFPEDGWQRHCGSRYHEETGQWEPIPLDEPVYFDRVRVENMRGPFVMPWRDMYLEAWRINYEHHTTMPDRAENLIVGGNYLTEDGWFCPTYPNCTYLIFVRRDQERSFLGGIMRNSSGPEEGGGFWQEVADLVAKEEGWELTYSTPEGDGAAGVAVSGPRLGGLEVTWSADTSPSKGHLYFSGNWSQLCPMLDWPVTAGTAIWSDESRSALSVTMNVDRGQGEELVYFEVALTPEHYVRTRPELMETTQPWDEELMSTARTLAAVMTGAEGYYYETGTWTEGSLPFSQPLELDFLSGSGGWCTELLLRPDGSFEGSYRDSDMGSGGPDYGATEYVCRFHGRFRDMAPVTAASWSLTLDELSLDTGRPVGEEWVEDRVRYVSSQPYGFDDLEGVALEPGSAFLLYTPAASAARPGSELYGLEDESSPLFEFFVWWPDRHELTGHAGTLGCYALRSLETGRSFFET